MEILLFGDQRADCHLFLKHVFDLKDNLVLSSFLGQVSVALREEVLGQPYRPYHEAIPVFESVQDLVERHYASACSTSAVESAVVCLAQLSHFICHFEELPESYPKPSSGPSSPHLFGSCTGLIAASAIASADSLITLLPLAVEAVRIAFRTGAIVSEVAGRLVGLPDALDSWSTTVAVTDKKAAESALEEWNQIHVTALSNKIWISAYALNTITISGPPSRRRRLLAELSIFSKAQQLDVSIHGPYHAGHLYVVDDVNKIISCTSQAAFGQSKVYFPVHSNVTGKPFASSSSTDLLRQCLAEILCKPLRLDRLLEQCSSGSLASLDSTCKIHTFGPSDLTSSFVSAVKSSGAVEVVTADHHSWLSHECTIAPSTVKSSSSDIAIVGMAGRFPDAADHEQFWSLLENGLDVHRTVPSDRYNVTTHTDPTLRKKNTSHTPYGNFIKEPGLFDARFFHMSPREAAQTDPMQRLELATAYEAMEMAGIVPGRTPSTKHDRIGTFYGMTSDDWREINAAQEIDTYFISGGVRAFGSGRINYYFKFSGPSYVVDTACSSSFAALQLACTSLQARDCDTAFTGGANVLTNPDIFSGLSRGHFLSRTGNCKTFDNDADGYCRGEGVATVILKRIEDAVADKDPILGVIRATATNHSAEAVSITHPHVGAQKSLFEKILRDANTNPRDVSYVEMHGTGTQAGDTVEMESVSSVFAPADLRRSPAQPLYLGSVKSNIGHGEAASGVCALIKVLLMMQNSVIPPHCGIKGVMNQNFPTNLKARNIRIATQKVPFPRPPGGKRIIVVNNFSAAGGNTGLLLEDRPEKVLLQSQDPRSFHVVTVSAKSLASFRRNLERTQSFISRISDTDLGNLSYTATARRLHYSYRAAFAVSDAKQLDLALAKVRCGNHSPVSQEPSQVAFAFTGQGSQYSAMGKTLFETSRVFRSEVEYFDGLAQAQGFASFLVLVSGCPENINPSPIVTQLGLVCVQMALFHLWTYWGLKPSVVIGHSLGEYAALYAAGVLSAADVIFLVGTRAQQLETYCTPETHAMLAVKASDVVVQKAIFGTNAEIACVNSKSELVISGSQSEIDSFSGKLQGNGIMSQRLSVPYAFHSSQVDPILDAFRAAASAITFYPPKIPVISPLLSKVVHSADLFNSQYLARHCRETVNFRGGLAAAFDDGTINEKTIWVEIGVHPVCTGMIKSSIGSSVVAIPSLRRGEDPWKTIANSLCTLYSSGVNVNWSAYHQEYEAQLEYLPVPAYSFDEKNFWLQYVNDWTLTKGDPPKLGPAVVETPLESFTTSVHRIIQQETQQMNATTVAESDLAHPLLHKVVAGHSVNGTGLCPSSLYADMALTLANYTYKLLRPGVKQLTMNVRSMENPAPLLLKGSSEPRHQIVQITTTVDLSHQQASTQVVSLSDDSKSSIIHAKCVVAFEDAAAWASEWERSAFLVRTRVDLLEKKSADGNAHRLLRGMVYKLFGSLVDYSTLYQGLKEVVLDTANLEANARIELQASPQDGTFYIPPYFIDSIGHLAGFIMNGNEGLDTKNQVFISHGWESMRLPMTLQTGKEYYSWVKMQPLPGTPKTFAGDVYLFDEEQKVIGVIGGLKFRCIPRQLLNSFIPFSKVYATQANAPHTPNLKSEGTSDAGIISAKTENLKLRPGMKVSGESDKLTRALNIFAREVGVDLEELGDTVELADLGIDSLMSLTISGHFREELGLDFESTAFADCVTVLDLKIVLESRDNDASYQHTSDDSNSGANTGVMTPDEDVPTLNPIIIKKNDLGADEQDAISIIRSTIAEQMNLDLEEIAETTNFSTMGMDSLMSLTILGILGEKTGRSFEPSLFADNTSMASLRRALNPNPKPIIPPAKSSSILPETPVTALVAPRVTSILLQGNTKTATQNLFLFPDGSGSPTSYSFIPPISPSRLCVYGLTCPFLKNPTSWTCGVRGVTKMYIEEILRRQPEGPYLIGGWSAGGVFAYEATRQMAVIQKENPTKNFVVERLVLLDSPCPVALEPLPSRLHVFFNQIGLLGDGNPDHTPSWLLPHFQATIDSLKAYEPALMKDDPFDAPETLLVWCTDGVAGNPGDPRPPRQDDDVEVMNWLLDNRTDFSSNGWEKLLGVGKFTCTTVPGHHFSMMKEPIASLLKEKIREGLGL